jgi:Domain of unknown function (DUF4262)
VSYDEVQRTRELLLTRIARYGYTMTQVIPTRESSGRVYTYTISLPQHIGHPELAVCGLSPEASMRVITSVVGLLEEMPEVEGRVVGAFANDVPCWIARVPDPVVDSYLGLAEWWRRGHHDGGAPTVKQIIVCDPAGRFPWNAGCEPRYRRGQSLLLPQITVREPSTTVTGQQGDASATG